jgi:manganese transport protein
LQLPFAVIPLIHFTADRKRMGSFTNPGWVRILAWLTALIIVGLNIKLVISVLADWIADSGDYRFLVVGLLVPLVVGLFLLLVWVSLEPVLPDRFRRGGRARAALMPTGVVADLRAPTYRRILVPLDHTDRDRTALAHAAALAKTHGAKIYLLHVEEGVTSQVYGFESSTAEVEEGKAYLGSIVEALRLQGIESESVVRHSNTPRAEIIRLAQAIHPDLLVMGAHGHSGIKDLIFGATINAVRHALEAPILIVRDPSRDGNKD